MASPYALSSNGIRRLPDLLPSRIYRNLIAVYFNKSCFAGLPRCAPRRQLLRGVTPFRNWCQSKRSTSIAAENKAKADASVGLLAARRSRWLRQSAGAALASILPGSWAPAGFEKRLLPVTLARVANAPPRWEGRSKASAPNPRQRPPPSSARGFTGVPSLKGYSASASAPVSMHPPPPHRSDALVQNPYRHRLDFGGRRQSGPILQRF
jgi:hypothetical protein